MFKAQYVRLRVEAAKLVEVSMFPRALSCVTIKAREAERTITSQTLCKRK